MAPLTLRDPPHYALQLRLPGVLPPHPVMATPFCQRRADEGLPHPGTGGSRGRCAGGFSWWTSRSRLCCWRRLAPPAATPTSRRRTARVLRRPTICSIFLKWRGGTTGRSSRRGKPRCDISRLLRFPWCSRGVPRGRKPPRALTLAERNPRGCAPAVRRKRRGCHRAPRGRTRR